MGSSGQSTIDEPISVNIDLHKVGRGGDGGDLIVGGKAPSVQDGIAGGIEVFNINVLGAGNDDPNGGMTKPSSLGSIKSTLETLDVVNIATDPVFAAGDTYASLEVRDGFDDDMTLINADAFLGDLALGTVTAVTDVDTITAQGGGDVTLGLEYTGEETATAYSVTTGAGDDDVTIALSGNALDYAGSSLNVSTGAGDDDITINRNLSTDAIDNPSQQLNQAILDNITVDGGAGDDVIDVDGLGNSYIMGGAGDDVIYTDGDGSTAQWAFNFDPARVTSVSGDSAGELPGVQTSLAYIGGATVTVTLSGAGGSGNSAAGGGVMSDGTAGAVIGDDGYESSVVINSLLNGNTHFGDQRDINLAVMEAINDDPILSNLLSVTMGANNTLVITSKTSGAFDATDLRIDIAQRDQGTTAAAWDGVEAEARSVFGDSDITIESLAGANPVNAVGTSLATSALADAWYEGLSNASDSANSTNLGSEDDSNLVRSGAASDDETDNVINGGSGDDLIVLSTDAVGWNTNLLPFSVSSNNALINGASNETVVMTGANFGNDTIMNFEDGDVSEVVANGQTFTFTGTSYTPNIGYDQTVVTITGLAVNGEAVGPVTYTFEGTTTVQTIAAGVADAVNEAVGFEVASASGPVITLVSPAITSGPLTADSITVTDVDLEGTNPTITFPAPVTLGTVENVTFFEGSGLDFLDFTAYLTSEENQSSASGSDSDTLIPVTLAADTTDVQANEVAVTLFNTDAADAGETFAALSASVVEQLFNNGGTFTGFGGDSSYGTLNAANFNADDEYGQSVNMDDLIGGAAKAILMIENADNDGEYKVFELTWNGDAANDTDGDPDGVVSAVALGSLDFGDSLTDLNAVNLVGSADYAALLDNGFFTAV